MNSSAPRPDITVVIPTHDRPASLLRLLRGLRDGTLPAGRFEVVVVADGCSDDTVPVVRAEPLPFPVRVLEQVPARGAAAARNLGASEARGSLLVFLDDDIEPGPELLSEHFRAHAESGQPAVAVGPPLPVRPANADLDMIAAWAWWEEQFARMAQPGHRFGYDEVYGADLSVPAALFRDVGGFNPDLKCREDGELGYRLIKAGARVLFVKGAWGRHHELRDLPRLIRRKRAEGMADVRLAALHPELWPALRLSWPVLPLWRPLGLLRRSALSAPWLARLLLGGLTGVLPLLERLHLRGTWRLVQAGVMYGWYWMGVAQAVRGRHGLTRLAADCHARTPPRRPPATIDLSLGLGAAARETDSASPEALLVRFGPIEVGSIAPRPGAEALRGEHLAATLGTDLPHEMIAALTTAGALALPHASGLRPRSRDTGAASLPPVSVIIAAHNAASTLGETLGSLLRQSHPGWEAIVVDDGSTDDTAALAERYAAQDGRIRVVRQARQGAGAARNTGLGMAVHPWALFLDADDWLLPHALERLCSAAMTSAAVDAVHGGWARVAVDGTVTDTKFAPPEADLFASFAQYCAFPILVCLFRRDLAARIGGFDPSLGTCEDWDFWQRLARLGARFVRINEKVAHYRMQPRSGATATDQVLPDGLAVIARGHAPDPRVPGARHRDGAPPAQLAEARFRFVSWVAGVPIGRGQPAGWFLDLLTDGSAPGLSPVEIATNLFRTVPLSMARGPGAWDELWPSVAPEIAAFLEALERKSGSWRLSRRVMLVLERLACDASRQQRPFTRGSTLAVEVEVARAIEAISAPAGVERVHCNVLAGGERIGVVLLPVCDGEVSASVLADAIAAEHAWPILGRFFSATRYRELELVRVPGGVALRLDGAPLAAAVPDQVATDAELLHDQVGWTLLLWEVWDAHGLPVDAFYRADGDGDSDTPAVSAGPWPVVEIGAALEGLRVTEPALLLEVRAGGTAIGQVAVTPNEGVVTPAALRAAIITEAGFELCRAVVREAVLGRPFAGEGLRARLAAAAEAARARRSSLGEVECVPASAAGQLQPGWPLAIPAGKPGLLLARYAAGLNTPADRRATLPAEVQPDLEEAARAIGPPLVLHPGPGGPGRVEYRPDLLWRPAAGLDRALPPAATGAPAAARAADRHHFEALFASGADPWSYDTPYEQLKYEQTLSIIPDGRIGRALELACAEGRFTRLLAPRVEELIAADFSRVALERAAAACQAPNTRFQLLDLVTDDLPGGCDLIVCSEVLYFLGDRTALGAVGGKLASALAPGGWLVLAHANLQVDDPDQPGFDWDLPYGARVIGETLAAVPSLQWRREIRTGAYRIQLFQRLTTTAAAPGRPSPQVDHAEYHPPAPHVAARFRRHGAARRPAAARGTTGGRTTLPILMYHSVAADGPPATARYRVTPERFEAQLGYLRDAGFSSVTIHEWLAAARNRRPLPGRSVLLTFDDGYADFAEIAWPLLRRHGFGALVFLVAGHVGGTSAWDADLGEPVRLMDWDQARRLAAEGVEFGSHSDSHRPMTGLSSADIAREAIRSRSAIARGLGREVTAFAYPHGDTDAVVQHLVGAGGFQAGCTCRPGRAAFQDHPLALPRIEVTGEADLPRFISLLGD